MKRVRFGATVVISSKLNKGAPGATLLERVWFFLTTSYFNPCEYDLASAQPNRVDNNQKSINDHENRKIQYKARLEKNS